MQTQATIDFLAAIGRLEFRELSNIDRYGFADAPEDARIAETLDPIIADPLGMQFGAIIIVGGRQIEAHGVSQDGEPIAMQWRLETEGC